MIKMVVFDMAGTTVDEGNVVYKTLQKAINESGVDVSFEEVLLHGAGKEKEKAIKDILLSVGIVNSQVTRAAFEYFLEHLKVAYQTLDIKPQPGTNQVFNSLKAKGIIVVLNTGYNKETAQMVVHKLDWQIGRDVDALITASDVPNNRPMPDMIELAMQQFGITNTTEVAKVGDSAIDIEEGKNAGCGITIGVTTGAHTKAQLQAANPTFVVNNLQEILPLIV